MVPLYSSQPLNTLSKSHGLPTLSNRDFITLSESMYSKFTQLKNISDGDLSEDGYQSVTFFLFVKFFNFVHPQNILVAEELLLRISFTTYKSADSILLSSKRRSAESEERFFISNIKSKFLTISFPLNGLVIFTFVLEFKRF